MLRRTFLVPGPRHLQRHFPDAQCCFVQDAEAITPTFERRATPMLADLAIRETLNNSATFGENRSSVQG
jgi:hypothetical protein